MVSYEYGGGPGPCPSCNEESVWYNNIDDTNQYGWGEIPMKEWKKLEIAPEVSKKM